MSQGTKAVKAALLANLVESLTECSVICSGDYGIDQDKYREED